MILHWMDYLVLESTATASLVKLECLILRSGSMVLVNWGVGGAGRRQVFTRLLTGWLVGCTSLTRQSATTEHFRKSACAKDCAKGNGKREQDEK